MRLYGLLDSPFVRRVAITLKHFGIEYEHIHWSVYRDAEALARLGIDRAAIPCRITAYALPCRTA